MGRGGVSASSCVVAITVIYSTRSDVTPATSQRGLGRVARPDVYEGPGGAGVHGRRYVISISILHTRDSCKKLG